MSKEEKCSKTQKNRIVIHRGDEEKRIYKGYINQYLAEGWELGPSEKHRKNMSQFRKGKEPWNKGLTKDTNDSLKVASEKISKHQREAYQNGQIPWNKDKGYKLTEEDIQNLSNLYNKLIPFHQCCKKLNIPWFPAYTYFKENNLMRKKSETLKGRPRSEGVKKSISAKNKGHEVSEKTRKAVSKANKERTVEQRKIQASKARLTKKLNSTFNTSKPEKNLYKTLLKENVNKTIYRQYKDKERYPYYCDFYIKEDDLFIELNAHWTHGGHPFDLNNKEDLEQLALWQEKAKTSKFYAQAIYVWTDLDPRKQQCAKDNNLNYKTIY